MAGRKTKYNKDFEDQAYKLSLLGCTNEELEEFFEISHPTFLDWRKKHPAFATAIKNGRRIANGEVIASMQKNATGYEHPDSQFNVVDGELVITEITKHYKPDPTSGIFILCNREPDKWKRKKEVDVTHHEVIEGFQYVEPNETDNKTD